MRDEGHARFVGLPQPGDLLGDLGLVSVALQPVRHDILVGLGEVVHRARGQAAAAGA